MYTHQTSAGFLFAVFLVALFCAPATAFITAGQIDDFENGTVMGWGGGANPTNFASGGPAGVDDNFLRIVANQPIGPGSRLAMTNDLQWSGNYIAQGVTAIGLDIRNTSPVPVQLRVLSLFGPGGDFTSATPVTVANDGQWHHIVLSILSADMLPVGSAPIGGFNYAATFSALPRLMLRHDPDPPSPSGSGDPINGVLDFDNITAIVPCTCEGDLDADTTPNGQDIQVFTEMYLGSIPPTNCADLAAPIGGPLDASDLAAFVDRLLDGSCS